MYKSSQEEKFVMEIIDYQGEYKKWDWLLLVELEGECIEIGFLVDL